MKQAAHGQKQTYLKPFKICMAMCLFLNHSVDILCMFDAIWRSPPTRKKSLNKGLAYFFL